MSTSSSLHDYRSRAYCIISSGSVLLIFFISQHYQKEADGLCCRLRFSVEKTGSHDFVVDTEEFRRR